MHLIGKPNLKCDVLITNGKAWNLRKSSTCSANKGGGGGVSLAIGATNDQSVYSTANQGPPPCSWGFSPAYSTTVQ